MEPNKKTLIQKMHIRLLITILIINVATLIISIVIANYSYFFGSILGSLGAIVYFYTLIISTNLFISAQRHKRLKRKFAFGFMNYFVKISIFGLIIFIAIKINYNFNSGTDISLWATSLEPINWWICFGILLLPAISAFTINIPWKNSTQKT